MTSIPAHIRTRAAAGASYGDVAHEHGVRLDFGMHPGAYDGIERLEVAA